MKKTFLTASGYEKIESELKALKEKRDQLTARLEEVSQPDDLGDDSVAVQLKNEIELVSAKITKFQEAVQTAQIITKKKSTQIDIGSTVTVEVSKSRHDLTIVGDLEADPSRNYISDQSPLGQALIGKRNGQKVSVIAPAGKITYKILKIS